MQKMLHNYVSFSMPIMLLVFPVILNALSVKFPRDPFEIKNGKYVLRVNPSSFTILLNKHGKKGVLWELNHRDYFHEYFLSSNGSYVIIVSQPNVFVSDSTSSTVIERKGKKLGKLNPECVVKIFNTKSGGVREIGLDKFPVAKGVGNDTLQRFFSDESMFWRRDVSFESDTLKILMTNGKNMLISVDSLFKVNNSN